VPGTVWQGAVQKVWATPVFVDTIRLSRLAQGRLTLLTGFSYIVVYYYFLTLHIVKLVPKAEVLEQPQVYSFLAVPTMVSASRSNGFLLKSR
jgi:hypothetical protein